MYTHKKKGEIKARETGTEFIFTPVKIFFDDNAFDDSGGVEDGGDDKADNENDQDDEDMTAYQRKKGLLKLSLPSMRRH